MSITFLAETLEGVGLEKWHLSLNIKKAERIRKTCLRPDSTETAVKTFDLLNIADQDQASFFCITDPETGRIDVNRMGCLVNMLYVICEEQCKERNIDEATFGEIMATGCSFRNAYAALIQEVENFIQIPEVLTLFQNMRFLAGGNRSAVLSEANRILTEKKNALLAQTTRIVSGKVETAWKTVETLMAKAEEESGTTTSSKPSAFSE